MMKFALSTAFCVMASASFAAPVSTAKTGIGDVLVGENGMTLYTFTKDSAGKSVCNDDCAVKWPPLKADEADAVSGDYSIIERDDNSYQWAYKGMPLYFWIKDKAAGDTTGEGVGGVWNAARP
jgi:predicted lipoprotein with Yx(FWY)xxD motif